MTKPYCYFQFECAKGQENQSSCALCPAYYPIYSANEVIKMTQGITKCQVIHLEDFKDSGK